MSKVYFIPVNGISSDEALAQKLAELLVKEDLLAFIAEKDMVAVKTHFGESLKSGFPRPVFLKTLGDLVKGKGALPFMTETSTLYKGNRNNAVVHTEHAIKQGFDYASTGMSIIMADGLYGDEESDVKINGRIYDSVKVASLLLKSQSFVCISHFTGHLVAGFGAALKNLGMGCASRRGKMVQHSTAKPEISESRCTMCNQCVIWCPTEAITMKEKSALIDQDTCIGCGECLAVCRFDAVKYNWGATYEDLQKKVVEHAMGVHKVTENKSIYITLLTRISKDCDCMPAYENICPDLGVLISFDPVSIDAAAIDLVEKHSGKKLSQMAYDIPYMFQVDYAREIGFGAPDYELVEVK
jgi:hypothetical protein